MNALRNTLKELKATLEKVPFLKSFLTHGKNIFAVGAVVWFFGGVIPDTAHFAVTLFSTIGRAAVFAGLFFALVKGEDDRSVMITSAAISVGAFIIIIVELSSVIYFGSFESYVFLVLFCMLAVNTSKYIKNDSEQEKPKEDETLEEPPAIQTHSIFEQQQEQNETQPDNDYNEVPDEEIKIKPSYLQTEEPPQPPTQMPEASAPPEKATEQVNIQQIPTQPERPKPLEIQRAPSIGSAPSVGPVPSIKMKPRE